MECKRFSGKFPEFPTIEEWQQPDFKFPIPGAAESTKLVEIAATPKKGGTPNDSKKASTPKDGKKDKKKGNASAEDITAKFNSYGISEFIDQGEKG